MFIVQEKDGDACGDDISYMPEVEQHLIQDVDGKD